MINEKYILESNNKECKYGEIANGYYELKKSKFYSYIFYIDSNEKVEKYIEIIRKDNKKARHIVYGYEYYIDNVKYSKFSNDNEPSKTGINAAINTMEHEYVTNYLIVIVRYYGGVLLRSWSFT
ncbi:MAG: YigZ family protein [Clostridia bacterium]